MGSILLTSLIRGWSWKLGAAARAPPLLRKGNSEGSLVENSTTSPPHRSGLDHPPKQPGMFQPLPTGFLPSLHGTRPRPSPPWLGPVPARAPSPPCPAHPAAHSAPGRDPARAPPGPPQRQRPFAPLRDTRPLSARTRASAPVWGCSSHCPPKQGKHHAPATDTPRPADEGTPAVL